MLVIKYSDLEKNFIVLSLIFHRLCEFIVVLMLLMACTIELWHGFQERNGLTKGYDSLKLELNEAKVSSFDALMPSL